MIIEGRVFKFGDDINTDYIISGRYKFSITDMRELSKRIFEDIRPDFASQIQPNRTIIVAGKNFGCGSSREQAPLAIREAGIGAVVAKSFARIFYRNAFNIGLALIEADTTDIKEDHYLRIDLDISEIANDTTGQIIRFKPLEPLMKTILQEAGIVNLIKKYQGWPKI